MKIIQKLILAIMAGISISFGCLIFLMSENKIVGATFFTLGLFLVLARGYHLFTGKIAYIPDNKPKYILDMLLMWLGNLCGAGITAGLVSLTRLNIYAEKAMEITQTKLSQTPMSAFILAVFCGFVIYFAVENYKSNSYEMGKYIGLFLLIPFFIICGFEHCVADMFYFIFAGEFTLKALVYLCIITLGNTTGSILLRLLKKHQKVF